MPTEEFVVLDGALMSYFVFGLALIRMSGLVIVAPFFSSALTPLRFRAGMAIFMALAVFPTAEASFSALGYDALNAGDMIMLAMQEAAVGYLIGFMSTIVFFAAQLAGDIAGQQIGFSMANVVDPFSNTDISLVGYLLSQIGSLLFLVLNLHLYLIYLLERSYVVVGIGAWRSLPYIQSCVANVGFQVDQMFIAALKLAIPIVTVMLMMSTMVGFITRTMPQMNIMVLDMPARIVVGLVAIMMLMPVFCLVYGGVEGTPSLWLGGMDEEGVIREMLENVKDAIADMRQ